MEVNLLTAFEIDNKQIIKTLKSTVVKDLFNLCLANVLTTYSNRLRLKIIEFLEGLNRGNDTLATKNRLIILKSGNAFLLPIAIIRDEYLKLKYQEVKK